jgi:Flp pilus assembly protein TadD
VSPSSRRALWLLVLAVLLATGCARRAPGPGAAARQTRSQALIDAGNALYRARDYVNAAKRYGAAVAVAPDDPAARFGLGMALGKLGRDEEARQAYARARELAQQARAAGPDSAPGRR